ncbi:hypothetical protein D3C86_2032270 [compost metagenome]
MLFYGEKVGLMSAAGVATIILGTMLVNAEPLKQLLGRAVIVPVPHRRKLKEED